MKNNSLYLASNHVNNIEMLSSTNHAMEQTKIPKTYVHGCPLALCPPLELLMRRQSK